jgi:hypothetical protein
MKRREATTMVNDANTPAVLRSRQVVLAIAIRIAVLTALIAFPLLEVGAQPVNDDCLDATPVSDGAYPYNLDGSTLDGPTICDGNVQNDVWFLFTAPLDGIVSIGTCSQTGTNDDSIIGVYDGLSCPTNTSTCLTSADDNCGASSNMSNVNIPVSAEEDYLIQVSGWNGEEGTGTLDIEYEVIYPQPCLSFTDSPLSGVGRKVALGDFDDNGFPDVVSGETIFLNFGGVLTPYHDLGMIHNVSMGADFAIGDLNGDARPDIFVSSYLGYSGPIFNLPGPGSGFPVSFASGPPVSGGTSVALGDVDDDGDLDAYIGRYGPNQFFFNDGIGFFTPGQSLTLTNGDQTHDVGLGDFDGDGDLDAVDACSCFFPCDTNQWCYSCTNNPQGCIQGPDGYMSPVWKNDGTGNFSPFAELGAFDIPLYWQKNFKKCVAVGDFLCTGGVTDQIVYGVAGEWKCHPQFGGGLGGSSCDTSTLGPWTANEWQGMLYSGSIVYGGFVECSMNLGGAPTCVNFPDGQAETNGLALGDFDGDGDLDLFEAAGHGGQSYPFCEPTTNRLFLYRMDQPINERWINSGLSLGDHMSTDVAVGDINGDGHLDAITVHPDGGWVYLNDGGCSAAPPTEICTNGWDDDCDGRIDCNDPDCFFNLDCQGMWLDFDPGIKLTPDPPGPGPEPNGNIAEHMALDDDKLVICTPLADAQGVDSGSVSIFQRDAATGGWQETQQLLPSNGSAMGHFGSSAATSANFIFIGAVGVGAAGPINGAVYVFERDPTGAWAESQILESAGASAFGTSLAVRGDLLAIGNPASSATSSDSVHLFTLDTQSGQWIELQQLIPPLSDGASFGSSIALGNGIILVGRPSDSAGLGPDTGSASVYIRDAASDSWVLEQELHSSTAQALEAFGESVAVGDGVLIISAFAPSAGPNGPPASARSFERDPVSGEWLEAQQLSCSSGCGAPGYQAMALEGDILVIGESQDPTPGSVTIYQRDLATCQWLVVQQLMPSAGSDGDGFGTSVAISGRTIAVGAPGDDELAPNAGAAYVFNGTGLLRDCNGNGTEDQEDIDSAFSFDCNGNGRPDECEIPCFAKDCNSNGTPDTCDIESGGSQDENSNSIPDECEPMCVAISQESISVDAAGNAEYSFTVTNLSGELPGTAEHLFMDVISPDGISITDEWQSLNGIPDGTSINLSTFIIGAQPGLEICFLISVHNATLNECCIIEHCVRIPGTAAPPCLFATDVVTVPDFDGDQIDDGRIWWFTTGLDCCQELELLHDGMFYMSVDILQGQVLIPSSVGGLPSMAGSWCLACPSTSGTTVNLDCSVHPFTAPPPEFLRGDANSDGAFDISDVVSGLGYLFQGQSVPCLVALDSNDDETVDISDSIYCLEALFGGGPAPWPPYQQCGVDETPGSLGCESFPACDENDSSPNGG